MRSRQKLSILISSVALALLQEPIHASESENAKAIPAVPPDKSPLILQGPRALSLLIGTWSIRVTYEPSADLPQGGTAEGTEVWRVGPGGRSLIEEYQETGVAGEYRGFGLAWWDDEAQGLRIIWCDSINPNGCWLAKNTAKWEGESLVLTEVTENNGSRTFNQEQFTNIAPNSFVQILKSGPSLEELKTTIAIHATRISQ